MSKPPGVSIGIGRNGPTMGVTKADRWVDKVWDAVEEAVLANANPKDLISEAREAWQYVMREEAKRADREFRKENGR